jgi:hypothetical protein
VLNWSTIISGVFTAVINSIAVLIATRYMAKVIERAEKKRDKEK